MTSEREGASTDRSDRRGATGGESREDAASTPVSWLRTTDWLWMLIGGFYLLAYLFWYIPALSRLPESVRSPPEQFPWHWPLDFLSTGLAGGVLVLLGFRRATEFADGGDSESQPRADE